MSTQRVHQFLQIYEVYLSIEEVNRGHMLELVKKGQLVLNNVHLCNNALYQFFIGFDGKNYIAEMCYGYIRVYQRCKPL